MSVPFVPRVVVVGAGPAGALCAGILGRGGVAVDMFEGRSRPGPKPTPPALRGQPGQVNGAPKARNRAIGVVLSNRGRNAMENAGIPTATIDGCTLPVQGRIAHARDGQKADIDFGGGVLYATDRHVLTRELMDWACESPNVNVKFDHVCKGVELTREGAKVFGNTASMGEYVSNVAKPLSSTDPAASSEWSSSGQLVIGADGINSSVAWCLRDSLEWHRRRLALDYTTIWIDDSIGLRKDRIHTYPRGASFLHILAHPNGGYVGTLVMPRFTNDSDSCLTNPSAFDRMTCEDNAEEMMARDYPDVLQKCPTAPEQIMAWPSSPLQTVHSTGQAVPGVVLVGDAAHGTVPFAGQGLNAALESSALLAQAACDGVQDSLDAICIRGVGAFERIDAKVAKCARERYLEGSAMIELSLLNYDVISNFHGSRTYHMRTAYQKQMSKLLPSKYPSSLYDMLNFSPLPYSEALEKVKRQNKSWKIGRL